MDIAITAIFFITEHIAGTMHATLLALMEVTYCHRTFLMPSLFSLIVARSHLMIMQENPAAALGLKIFAGLVIIGYIWINVYNMWRAFKALFVWSN